MPGKGTGRPSTGNEELRRVSGHKCDGEWQPKWSFQTQSQDGM